MTERERELTIILKENERRYMLMIAALAGTVAILFVAMMVNEIWPRT